MRHALGDLDAAVFVETDEEWLTRVRGRDAGVEGAEVSATRASRIRLIGSRDAVGAAHADLARAVDGDPDVAVYDGEVTSAGRIELLPFVHEQAISITAHRFGNPDPVFTDVI